MGLHRAPSAGWTQSPSHRKGNTTLLGPWGALRSAGLRDLDKPRMEDSQGSQERLVVWGVQALPS